ncbi:hypothetical protein [Streptomyces lancefieldiae]|uniref:Transposase n=1 Tax=Streptomyces lancefieldiae TaxID=3075520 RepID=A0ABU3AII9_9ACTN|nr:hypothetical protein [Streptomyces sp. DSM 40712]MDT0609996.1 hypothetical protein [Streptomyces sp. DSM 40712]
MAAGIDEVLAGLLGSGGEAAAQAVPAPAGREVGQQPADGGRASAGGCPGHRVPDSLSGDPAAGVADRLVNIHLGQLRQLASQRAQAQTRIDFSMNSRWNTHYEADVDSLGQEIEQAREHGPELLEQYLVRPMSQQCWQTLALATRSAACTGWLGSPSIHPAWNRQKRLRGRVIQDALATVEVMPGTRAGAVWRHTSRTGRAYYAERAAVYESLLQLLDYQLADVGDQGIIVMDGDGTDAAYQRAHRKLKLATRHIVEDPWFIGSRTQAQRRPSRRRCIRCFPHPSRRCGRSALPRPQPTDGAYCWFIVSVLPGRRGHGRRERRGRGEGGAAVVPRAPGVDQENGRGLLITDALAARWDTGDGWGG